MDALSESLAEPYPNDLEIAGAIVTVDHEGKLRIERGLIQKEDIKKLSSGLETGIEGTSKNDEPKPMPSEKLTRMLTAHRGDSGRTFKAAGSGALGALVHRMVLHVFLNGHVSNRIVQINPWNHILHLIYLANFWRLKCQVRHLRINHNFITPPLTSFCSFSHINNLRQVKAGKEQG